MRRCSVVDGQLTPRVTEHHRDLVRGRCIAQRLHVVNVSLQEVGGTRKTVEAGIAFVREALADANKVKRETVPASELTVALQCGGSDG